AAAPTAAGAAGGGGWQATSASATVSAARSESERIGLFMRPASRPDLQESSRLRRGPSHFAGRGVSTRDGGALVIVRGGAADSAVLERDRLASRRKPLRSP